ncbi:hypothetical protein HanPI659440_Chr13g0492411 [Helianthus annuus]|nr:hypothetical protein HanPI659440_Chr13g0492411 [Helianthus annuus]
MLLFVKRLTLKMNALQVVSDVRPFAWKDGYRDKEPLAFISQEVSTQLG